MIETLFGWLGRLDILFSLVAAAASCRLLYNNWRTRHIRQKLIHIVLVSESGEQWEMPYRPRRDQLSRQELQGILGVYSGPDRYDLHGLRDVLSDGSFTDLLDGGSDVLQIRCSDAELAKFKFYGSSSASTDAA